MLRETNILTRKERSRLIERHADCKVLVAAAGRNWRKGERGPGREENNFEISFLVPSFPHVLEYNMRRDGDAVLFPEETHVVIMKFERGVRVRPSGPPLRLSKSASISQMSKQRRRSWS